MDAQLPLPQLIASQQGSLGILESLQTFSDDLLAGLFPMALADADMMTLPTFEPLRHDQIVLRTTKSEREKIFAWRLQYAMEKVAGAPRQMVLENQTPWCHPKLYESHMPQSMQDALSTCALQSARNDVNTRVIRNCIESRVQSLLFSPVPTASPLEMLARAQALFLYQIIRLSDPDPRIRDGFDAAMIYLEEAATALIPSVSFDDPQVIGLAGSSLESLPLFPITETRDFWNSWVFQESARRTVAMISFFALTYHYVRGDPTPPCHDRLYASQSATLSAPLWKAQDPVDFALAWRSKAHYFIHGQSIDSMTAILESARADDIDDFGKMLLSTVMGKDDAKGWLALRDVSL